MQGLRQMLWRYWVVVICAAAVTVAGRATGADVAPPSPDPVINVVEPEFPALLVDAQPAPRAVPLA